MGKRVIRRTLSWVVAALGFAGLAVALEQPKAPELLLFGDLHIHTSYSADAFIVGNRTSPDDAYNYARGKPVRHALGYSVQLQRPLDFAAVTDHAEYLGVLPELARPGSKLADTGVAGLFNSKDPAEATQVIIRLLQSITGNRLIDEFHYPEVSSEAWQQMRASADRHYLPGEFTTFPAFEWGSMVNGNSIHRNVIFKTSKTPASVYGAFDSPHPEGLWSYLEDARARGMEVLAIPHNANMSNGLMYPLNDSRDRPIDSAYSRRRMRNEPVSELVQIKGQSEIHPLLASGDEFAGQALYDYQLGRGEFAGSYIRTAYQRGLFLEAATGANPYQFGVIGSSDSHNSTSPVEEDNYSGKLPVLDGTPRQRLRVIQQPDDSDSQTYFSHSSGGLAAVWAMENSRDAIFEAIQRREVYATSGTRIKLRLFAGWGLSARLLDAPDYANRAYASGVPMGSVLAAPDSTNDASPDFIIVAAKDPAGANLDRVQVIKFWLDAEGNKHERIYNVVWAGQRALDDAGRLPAIGSSVNVVQASYRNTLGARQLRSHWRDPDFNPRQRAGYYLRVLEIPTPRWSTYDARTLGIKAPEPATIQEMAWSSPIWYQPPR